MSKFIYNNLLDLYGKIFYFSKLIYRIEFEETIHLIKKES
jgi:hypothetical protein